MSPWGLVSSWQPQGFLFQGLLGAAATRRDAELWRCFGSGQDSGNQHLQKMLLQPASFPDGVSVGELGVLVGLLLCRTSQNFYPASRKSF